LVNRDYFHRILDLKRKFHASFCVAVHDLIPIFARETCDQGQPSFLKNFFEILLIRGSLLYGLELYGLRPTPLRGITWCAQSSVSVIENGHSFDEFAVKDSKKAVKSTQGKQRFGKDGYVLFVSTIEGRKNHAYIFDVWEELSHTRPDLPVLICVDASGGVPRPSLSAC